MERKEKILFILILLLAFALRLDFLIANNFTLDSDEAIVGLMAKHINEGKTSPIFYYGQHYLGSLEAYAVAGLFKIFGFSAIALKAVPLIFSLIFVVLVFFLTKEIADKRAGFLAMLISALAPSTLLIWSGKARGGFIEVLVFGALILLLSLKWQKREDKNLWYTFFIAFLFGIAWWVNNQILYFIPAVGIIYLTRIFCDKRIYFRQKLKNCLKQIGTGFCAFFLGSILFWIYNFQNDFASFGMFESDTKHFWLHVEDFFNISLPILIGSRRFWSLKDIYLGLTPIAISTYFFLFVIFFFKSKEKKKYIGISNSGVFLTIFISIIFIFSYSRFGSLAKAPRYLLPLYVILFPMLGMAINKLWSFKKFMGISFLSLILALNLISAYAKKRALLGEPLIFQEQRASDNHDELISWLKEKNIHLIRTNYWIGYRLAFETNEDVKFLVTGIPRTVRIKSYEKLIKKDKRDFVPILVVPREARYMRSALSFLGFSFKEKRFPNYRFIYDIKNEIHEKKLKLINKNFIKTIVSDNEGMKENIMDGSVLTRWGSAKPQNDKMFVRFDFKYPIKVQFMKYFLGEWEHDYPRDLEIVGIDRKGVEKILLTQKDYEMFCHYVGDYTGEMKIKLKHDFYKSIILYQKGTDSFFDWSIAEIKFYN